MAIKKTHVVLTAALSTATAHTSAMSMTDSPAPDGLERCAGMVKKGLNDCAALDGSHFCAGQAAEDSMDIEWVYVPKGLCNKIVGGKLVAVKTAKTHSDDKL